MMMSACSCNYGYRHRLKGTGKRVDLKVKAGLADLTTGAELTLKPSRVYMERMLRNDMYCTSSLR